MFHEMVELVKALAWPALLLYVIVRYRRAIDLILKEVPDVIKRMRSAHGLGIEIELDQLAGELPEAERQASSLSLQVPSSPVVLKPTKGDHDDQF